jgi:hypothetical protein
LAGSWCSPSSADKQLSPDHAPVEFGLLSGDADEHVSTGSGMKGRPRRERRGAELAIRRLTMTEGPEAEGTPPTSTHEQGAPGQDWLAGLGEPERRESLAWMGEHLPELRRSAFGQRLLYQSLGVGFVVGLAAHVGGYLLKSSVTTEPLVLVADLLYALGYSLWTGVVVVVFVQIVPEAKRRQFKQALDAYEAAQRDQARAGSDQASRDDEAPTARERSG